MTKELTVIENCACCNKPLHRGQTVIVFQSEHYCDVDCLIERFTFDPRRFGVTEEILYK